MKKISKKKLIGLIASLAIAGSIGVSKYNRSHDFGGWIDEDGDCQNTRQEVLIRDAEAPPTLSEDGCKVIKGLWNDPYTGEIFTNPKDLDIDHLVPLKNAYISGADQWDKEKRVKYANYLGNDYHLIAVKASENRKKSDKGPEKYLPPKKDYQCQYVSDWTKVKNEWKLSINSEEAKTILKICNQEVVNY